MVSRWRRTLVAGSLVTAVLCGGAYSAQAAPSGQVADPAAVAAANTAAARAGQPAATGTSAEGVSVAGSGPAKLTLTARNNLQLSVTAAGTSGSREVANSSVADAGGGAKVVSQAVVSALAGNR